MPAGVFSLRSALAAVLIVPALALSACEEAEPEPTFAPPTPSATSSAPEETEAPKPESPEAFVRRFMREQSEMENTGNTEVYRTLYRKCPQCEEVADKVESFYAKGGFVKNGGVRITRVQPMGRTDKTVYVEVSFEASPTTYKESKDSPEQRLPGGPTKFRLDLIKDGDTWRVTQVSEYAL